MISINRFKRIVEPTYNKVYRWYISLFYYLPIRQKKIVFIQSEGGGYRCNLKYVAEEIISQGISYDMVWLVNNKSEPVPSPIRKVKYNRIRAVYELATAHVFINDSKGLYPVKKKTGQKFIYIPHGQPGCKCAEADAILPEDWVKNSQLHSSLMDVFVSMGTYHTQVLKDTFWVPKNAEIWEVGFPRNDMFYRDTTEKQLELRKKLNIPDGYRIVLYAPTFRANGKNTAYDLDLHRLLNTLEQKTGDKWLCFLPLHRNFIWFPKPPYHFDEQIWDMSEYRDLHELLLIVDVAISDYSSVSLDFSNLRRPVFLYASDLEEYRREWGLKDMYFKLPFQLCQTNDEINDAIINFDKVEYDKRLASFYQLYGSVDDGHAAERFVKRLHLLMGV